MSLHSHRYTRRVVRIVDLARKEAERLESKPIGSEHLLLALLREEGGAALLALRGLQVNASYLHRMTCAYATRGAPGNPGNSGAAPARELTSQARQAIDLAEREAQRLGDDYLGSEHVLLGLLHQGQGVAGWVLAQAGLTLDATRAQVQQLHTSGKRFDNTLADREAARAFRAQVAPRPGYPYQPSSAVPVAPATFSPAARAVLAGAHTAAERTHQTAIGPEHLLLALLARADDVPARALTSLGCELSRLRAALESLAGHGAEHEAGHGRRATPTAPIARLPLSPHARLLVARAVDEARRLQQTQVAPAHLLLALASEREGVVAAALRRAGADPVRLYARTRERLRPAHPHRPPDSP